MKRLAFNNMVMQGLLGILENKRYSIAGTPFLLDYDIFYKIVPLKNDRLGVFYK